MFSGFLNGNDSKCEKFNGEFFSNAEQQESCEDLYWFPQFLSEACLKTEYNIEWKRYLLNKNSEEVIKSASSKDRFTFYTPKIIKCIFNLCKLFKQPPEVRYLAVEIFDRFLVDHFFKVSDTFEMMEKDSLDTWEDIVERMLSQSPLRILTSVQLAMKYSWSSNILTITDIQEIMKLLSYGEQYSKRSIVKSEARVYQHLGYNITIKSIIRAYLVEHSFQIPNQTPFKYLEMFFDDLYTYQLFDLDISLQDFFTICIHVLDIAIIFHKKVYGGFEKIRQNSSDSVPVKTQSNIPLKANFLLLAASVVFAASFLEEPNSNTSNLRLGILCSISECRKSDIEQLAQQILAVIDDILRADGNDIEEDTQKSSMNTPF